MADKHVSSKPATATPSKPAGDTWRSEYTIGIVIVLAALLVSGIVYISAGGLQSAISGVSVQTGAGATTTLQPSQL
ncbi:MAG: hypothetical protein NT051_02405, partial [Candidatus Micrarchaeota archaeon]|nr:hypothetical protein [Candidatus Micrarchaeota archaeon]